MYFGLSNTGETGDTMIVVFVLLIMMNNSLYAVRNPCCFASSGQQQSTVPKVTTEQPVITKKAVPVEKLGMAECQTMGDDWQVVHSTARTMTLQHRDGQMRTVSFAGK